MSCLIIFKSMTYAQAASTSLSKQGISSYVTKPPLTLGSGSCAYALRINYNDLQRAMSTLRSGSSIITGVYTQQANGSYREVGF